MRAVGSCQESVIQVLPGFRPHALAVALAPIYAMGGQGELANPTGPPVANGRARFHTRGSTLTAVNTARGDHQLAELVDPHRRDHLFPAAECRQRSPQPGAGPESRAEVYARWLPGGSESFGSALQVLNLQGTILVFNPQTTSRAPIRGPPTCSAEAPAA